MILDLSSATLSRKIVSPNQTFEQYLTLEESHTDEVIIPEHPVEVGAVMSDHIYMRPPTLRLRLGWSNADGVTSVSYVRDTYADLLLLKNARQLFIVYTGKRFYKNMFVLSLRVHTDEKWEWAMVAECDLKQLMLVSTKRGSNATPDNTAAPAPSPKSNAAPEKTALTVGGALTQPTGQSFDTSSLNISGFRDSLFIPDPVPETGVPNSDGGGSGPPGPPAPAGA